MSSCVDEVCGQCQIKVIRCVITSKIIRQSVLSGVSKYTTMEEENDAAAAAAAAPDAVGQEATKQTNNDESSNAAVDGTADAKDTASSGRAKRVRKATTTYVPEEETKKEIIIPDGKGEKLQDMPNVVAKFQDITWSNPGLKHLYNIVFGRGKKADFKKHLLQFNGLVFSEGNEEAEKDKLLEKVTFLFSYSLFSIICMISYVVVISPTSTTNPSFFMNISS